MSRTTNTTMTQRAYAQHYHYNHKAPCCVSCKSKIHIGEKIERCRGRKVKYLCQKCERQPVVVYQYPMSTSANAVGEKFYAKIS